MDTVIQRTLGNLVEEKCVQLHDLFNGMEVHSFPFDEEDVPENGIYILFERGEDGHGGRRIVRVGTHTGDDQLRSRIKQHFITENKDRSIFRKNIGRALLNRDDDPFLDDWNLDLTTRAAKEEHLDSVDLDKQEFVERRVTEIIQSDFAFAVIRIDDKDERLRTESRIISTVSWCTDCGPSEDWLGLHSPKKKIRESGLWLVNELWKEPFSEKEIDELLEREAV